MKHSTARRPTFRGGTNWRIALGLHPDFPLFIHNGTGYWAKKVRQKLHYFGKVADDPKGDAALKLWLARKDDLIAGRTPRDQVGGLRLHELCNKFLAAKLTDRNSGKITARTFVEYHRSMKFLVETFGRDRLVADLHPEDFTALYAKLAGKFGINTLGREVTMVRSVFRYGKGEKLLVTEVEFGTQFKAPGKVAKRKARAKRQHQDGLRMFTADELRAVIAAASHQLKAMLLLGANCGFGNTDCSSLPLSALDLEGRWVDYPRQKTGIDRRCPLWPETVAALRVVVKQRPKAKTAEYAKLVFLTRLGQPWVRYEMAEPSGDGKAEVTAKADDAVAKATTKLLTDLKLKRPGLSFYALRHGFETIAGRCGDQVAVDFIMGHADDSMGGNYREFIDDDRLRRAVQVVHDWLYPPKPATGGTRMVSNKSTTSKPRQAKAGGKARVSADSGFQFRIVG